MGWVRLDDAFYDHPKVQEVGPLGLALWVTSIAWSNRNLTDGFVPRAKAKTLLDWEGVAWHMWRGEIVGGGEDAEALDVAAALVNAGLWVEADGGFRIHDYHDYQPSKDEVEAGRRQKQEAGRKGAAVRWGSGDSTRHSGPMADAIAPAIANGWQNDAPNPKKEKEKEKEPAASADAERRADVDSLCDLLAKLVEENGCRRPSVTKQWKDEARRLLDKDGVERDEAERVMRWALVDSFWRTNVLSMPTFRKQFDRLRLAAGRAPRNGNGSGFHAPSGAAPA